MMGACSNEPSHNGRSLGEWTRQVEDLDSTGSVEAAEAIAAMGPEAQDALPALFYALLNGDAAVRTAAYEAVAAIRPDQRGRALGVLRRGGPDSVPALGVAFAGATGEVRRDAIVVLHELAPDDPAAALPILLEALEDEDVETRHIAVITLAKLGESATSATPALRVALDDKEPSVRAAAVRALGKIGGPEAWAATQEMEALLSDESVPPDRPLFSSGGDRSHDRGPGLRRLSRHSESIMRHHRRGAPPRGLSQLHVRQVARHPTNGAEVGQQ